MGAEEIVRKIKEEAEAECEKIISDAEANRRKRLAEAMAEVEEQKKSFVAASEQKAREEKEGVVRAARLNARKVRWDAEEKIIAEVLEEAAKALKEVKKNGFKGRSYSEILAGLIKDAAVSVVAAGAGSSSELEVRLSEEDASFVTPEMLKELSAEVERSTRGGMKVRLSVSGERIKSEGGVVVSGRGGKVEVNNTFEQRMARLSSGLREEIVKSLFAEK